MPQLQKLEGLKGRFEEVQEYAKVAAAVVTIAIFVKKRVQQNPTPQENNS
jgi:hypothetical protein